MTEQPTTEVSIKIGNETVPFRYPRLYMLSEFLEKYGEDNCTIMLQDREKSLYQTKAIELLNALKSDPDRVENAQVALDDWKPCDDRPPTELETLANNILNMPVQAQIAIDRHIRNGIKAAKAEQAKQNAETAAKVVEDMADKYTTEDVGAPVTTLQTEPVLESFEEQGRVNDEAVKAAQNGQSPALVENAEDYQAPSEFQEGGTEGVVIEGAPPAPVPDVTL